jgi:hypothetical protein
MAVDLHQTDPPVASELPSDFTSRLEASLQVADSERRRRALRAKLAALVPVVLLAGPLLAWVLTSATPGGEHIAVDGLVSLTFVLDAGLHVDSAVLSYLHLAALPALVGGLLLVMTALWLLWEDKPKT